MPELSAATPGTGVAVPLSSLRSQSSFGIGEFADLTLAAQWCQASGLDLIQLLPINDTGYEPSPYSALSAYALHPVYLRLSDLSGFAAVKKEAEALRTRTNGLARVDHQEVWKEKQHLLKLVFAESGFTAADAEAWLAERPWGRNYAVFSALRERYQRAGWQSWPEHRHPSQNDILALWNELGSEGVLQVWMQTECEHQLSAAVGQMQKLGVALKGDIPILLNEDSADVWAHPEFFDLGLRAGAPPDDMNPDGQNWGFPVYNWSRLEKDGYGWWKQRLEHAARFYQAYRIDHVLGFFRIWATPAANFNAQLGLYQPTPRLTTEQLGRLGFDSGRITWMSEPHIFGLEIRERLGQEAQAVIDQALVQLPGEDLYRFASRITGEKVLQALPLGDNSRENLVHWFRNRTLLRLADGTYTATAHYYSTRAYDSLGNEERWNFERLVHETSDRVQGLWEDQGRRLLSFMKSTTNMLVCAEDLGSIPACVPGVLNDLGILGLRIIRWARDWSTPGQPYIPVNQYPELTVCTPSVHDTSTLRQWWDEERNHQGFLLALGLSAHDDGPFSPAMARKLLAGILTTRSRLCILALPDLLALDERFMTADPALERVNTPGTVDGSNWAYRMKPSLEELVAASDFSATLHQLVEQRKKP
ncbi:MAG: 4-alpha-glucanotransferase [Spirochaetales bacterium]